MKKTKQIAFGILVVLSLLASSVSACVCSHHAEKKVETETASCHKRSEKNTTETSQIEKTERLKSHDSCFCLEAAPRVFSKSETVKIEKQAAVLPVLEIRAKTFFAATRFENFFWAEPFYFSDSFYNLKSPRAPPAA